MPARCEFNKLQASVFGTHVNVSCQTVASDYAVVHGDVDIATEVDVAIINIPGVPNHTFVHTLQESVHLALSSAITVDSVTSLPTLTMVIPNTLDHSTFVAECTYSGQKHLADVFVASTFSPLQIEGDMSSGSFSGPVVKQQEEK